MHRSSYDKMSAFRDRHLAGLGDAPLLIYDLGSCEVSGGSYRPLFDRPPWRYRGIDLAPGPNVDVVVRDPCRWREIPSRSADVVVSGQALEHAAFFWVVLLEVRRVLKPGGLCCIIAPSAGPEHRYPVDCWRFFPDGMAALARFAALEALEIYSQDGDTGYPDGSDLWRDTVLVGRKPFDSPAGRLRESARRCLLRALTVPRAVKGGGGKERP